MRSSKFWIIFSAVFIVAFWLGGVKSVLAECSDLAGGIDYCPSIVGGTRCAAYGVMPSCDNLLSEIAPAAQTALNCDNCTFSCASGWADCDGNIRSNGCEIENLIGRSCTIGGAAGVYTGTPCSLTCTATPRYVSRQHASPGTAEKGYINIKGNVRITPNDDGTEGDLYLNSDKAIRVDGDGTTSLNIGNWVGDSLNLKVFGNMTTDSLTLGGVRRTNWPEGQWLSSEPDIYYSAGNVGIGTNDPRFRLHVVGNSEIQGVLSVTDGLSVTGGITGSGNINLQASPLGVLLDGADRPLITRGYDPFTDGNYKRSGRWGIFMEPNRLTIGVPNLPGKGIQFASYDPSSEIVERLMSIQVDGKVGIGTNNPDSNLHISAPSAVAWPGFKVQGMNPASGVDGLRMQTASKQYNIGVGGATNSYGVADKLFIWDATAGQQRLVIDSEGRVGIGTNTPVAQLNVSALRDVDALKAEAGGEGWAEVYAIYGSNRGIGPGVYGLSNSGDGVVGQASAANKSGVYGNNTGSGFGVYGRSKSSSQAGVGADNSGPNGVSGDDDDGPALKIDSGRLSVRAVDTAVTLTLTGGIYTSRVNVGGAAVGTITIPVVSDSSRQVRIRIDNSYVTSNSKIFLTPAPNPGSVNINGFDSLGVHEQANGYFGIFWGPPNYGGKINFMIIN
ncbi:MAG: hypothetical protein UX98_C0010G0019 [Parcubacteria group bacterium GW2011_GWA2_47_26]|nr:MAG: hypothetical protein UX98_C0010G0019 [Parcubacteria group bacterium GW2011_GWA2_47_26]